MSGLKFKKYFHQYEHLYKNKSIPDLVILGNSKFCVILLMDTRQEEDTLTIKFNSFTKWEHLSLHLFVPWRKLDSMTSDLLFINSQILFIQIH